MSSQIEISNVALVRLGANAIQSLSEGSNEAIVINTLWEVTRRALLSMHTWNFALTESELSQVVTPNTPIEFTYRYKLPSDLIRLVKIVGDINYRIVGSEIFTNSETCKIRYVADITDTAAWTPTFADLFAARLAFELAYPITKNQSSATAAQQTYEMKLRDARFIDSTQDIPETLGQGFNSLIASRY